MQASADRTVAALLVACLENEGVEYVFGLPGEENLDVIDALVDSSIRFVTTRDERGAAFMADTYGALTGKAGVCLATLGPGAINLMLGIANAQLDSHPLVAIMAQAGLDRLYKESHQVVDLGLELPVAVGEGREPREAAEEIADRLHDAGDRPLERRDRAVHGPTGRGERPRVPRAVVDRDDRERDGHQDGDRRPAGPRTDRARR